METIQSNNIYEDQENRLTQANLRNKGGGVPLKSVSNGGQRTGLSVLSSLNTTNIRVQPRRAAKHKQDLTFAGKQLKSSQDENVNARRPSQQSKTSFSSTLATNSLSSLVYSDQSSNSSDLTEPSVDKASLNFASARLDEQLKRSNVEGKINVPRIFKELPSAPLLTRSRSIESEEMLDVEDDDCNMSVISSPTESQEDLLKLREEQMYDMLEYSDDIYCYLRESEKQHRPRINYMTKQSDISASMRWILVDWMVEVAEEYNISTEGLYLAVSYIDRFLSHMSVKRDKLQLVGTTAMFIAAKYEEIYPPEVTQFAYITDNTYKVQHILRMEHLILKVLSFDMAVPTVCVFLRAFARAQRSSDKHTSLAMFIAELSLLDPDPFLRYHPSEIAASAIAISNFTLGMPAWPPAMTKAYGYTLEDLQECYVNLNTAFGKVPLADTHAVREKYGSDAHCQASKITARLELPFSS